MVETTAGRSCTGVDPELAAVVEKKLVKHGGKILKSAKALGYEKQADGSVAVRDRGRRQARDDRRPTSSSSPSGMRPNGAGLGLEELGVKVERGFVPTDNVGRTNVPGIYAIGD